MTDFLQRPTVGRAVHFFNTSNAPSANNGVGAGPYHAVVTQTFPDGEGNVGYVNLIVFPPFAEPFHEGSVSQNGDKGSSRYWEWPARV